MENFVNLFAPTQTIIQPSRGGNVLDLLVTNESDLVKSTLVMRKLFTTVMLFVKLF